MSRVTGQHWVAFSLTLFAAAVVFLAIKIGEFSQSLSEAATAVETLTPEIPGIVTSVDSITDKIPSILEEVEEIRGRVDKVLTQSSVYVETIPQILAQVDAIQNDIGTQMPEVLARVDSVVAQVDSVVATAETAQVEMAKWRPVVGDVTKQLDDYQVAIPGYLTRVDGIIMDVQSISDNAGTGLVGNLFKGVISLPGQMVSGVSGLAGEDTVTADAFSQTDIDMIRKNLNTLLTNEGRQVVTWENKETGNKGSITRTREFKRGGRDCVEVDFRHFFTDGNDEMITRDLCKNRFDEWVVQ